MQHHARINDISTVAFKCPQKFIAMLQNPCNPTTDNKACTRHCCCSNPKINPSTSRADPSNDHDNQTINTIINEISSFADYRPQPLAHNWTQGIYTDGCKTEVLDPYTGHTTTVTGAACHVAYEALTADGGKLYLINPNGQCEANTINRAELGGPRENI